MYLNMEVNQVGVYNKDWLTLTWDVFKYKKRFSF